eukprot:CAMPEP_0194179984 /NCGR_PEP_ID=MMETSP0154-20130528/13329_1 /TAXON_ID=1049557 /ORGANISM="Thalassiothrix antarctica, Strain L6-D1" /LENGTH=308 /DNA_ID=CAMNT_0038895517 /DNA_START=84 /DNA_END=1007 /DNA_ORIENTATION=+
MIGIKNIIRNERLKQSLRTYRYAFSTAPPPQQNSTTTHFGYEDINVEQKEGRVREVFENVAESYDLMNDLMSGGLHRVWKDYLVKVSRIASMSQIVRSFDDKKELKVLDVAGGTGDIAFRFVDACGCRERSKSSGVDPISITVCDINDEMLRVGERRARQRYGNELLDNTRALSFVNGNAQDLHNFEDNSFDLYTIAFGLRNVTDVDRALREAHRVLKPGGRYTCLEFSQVPNEYLRKIYDTYSFNVIPSVGDIVAKDRASYQYLVESIRKFSNQSELEHKMSKAGLQHVKHTNLSGGIVALHEGYKD